MKKTSVNRHGVEVIEMALVLPVLVILTFGTLEVCEGIFLKQKLEVAASEGARIAIRKMATTSDVEAAVEAFLDARQIQYTNISSVVSIDPSPTTAAELTPIKVTVTVDTTPNLRLPLSVYSTLFGRQITADVTFLKEYAHP